ncbi:MAG: hypothetical protein U0586_03425 [Candidatus Brocadiaceae bacterium]
MVLKDKVKILIQRVACGIYRIRRSMSGGRTVSGVRVQNGCM